MTHPPLPISRRHALGLIGAPALVPAILPWLASGAVAAPNDTIKVLYRKESQNAPHRIEPVVEAALRALEDEFLKSGFRVLQPSAEAYRFLDQGPGVTVTFAADAGFSMLVSLSRTVRPRPGSDTGFVDVQLNARVFVGANVLSVDQGAGSVMVNLAPDTREYAERMGGEEAVRKAAQSLVASASRRLRAIDPARLAEMSRLGPIKDIYDTVPVPVVPPPPPAPVAAAPATAATPATGPAAAPAPAAVASNEPLPPPARRFALVITMADYAAVRDRTGSKVSDLPGVAKDRRNMLASLKQLGFSDDKTLVLSDAQATSAAVMTALSLLQGEVKDDDLVLVAIAGHGAAKDASPSGFGMPVLSDYTNKPGGNMIDFWTLQSLVGNMRARRTVMLLDTCHSGGGALLMSSGAVVTSSGVAVQSNPQNAELMASVMGAGRHFAVVAAARPEQSSYENATGGLFTNYLMEALRKSAAQQPLSQIFAEQVEKQIPVSAERLCGKQCQQNPVFAFRGRGDMIRL